MNDTMTEADKILSELGRLAGRNLTNSRKDKERMVGLMFNRLITARRDAYEKGRREYKENILSLIQGCLDRDPTLQKLVKSIEEIT